MSSSSTTPSVNSARHVLFASLVGTTIEYFDFYIYGTAAVLVFPALFFPASDPAAATLASLATFGIAFLARPVGAALFGHFGDRVGRKTTLVAALLTMGGSTVAIGLLPSYASIGLAAPILLAICRFGQGLGLGGEWGGAVLLAIENAPPGKRAWYGMFAPLGAPLGFLLSTGAFLALSNVLTDDQFLAFGWRIPFLASAALVLVGLYVRLALTETPVFAAALSDRVPARLPMLTVLRSHPGALITGTLTALATFVTFYLMTVFALAWGTAELGFTRDEFLRIQLVGVVCLAATIPIAAILAEGGRRRVLIGSSIAMALFGLVMGPLLSSGRTGAVLTVSIGLGLMGLSFGPLGTLLSELFPTKARYTGSSLTFSLAGIFGASLAPYIATSLANSYGLQSVGYYLTGAALLSLGGVLATGETRDRDLTR
jgi:metabolite-proton symporter